MVEFVTAALQGLCILGLAGGAYLSIRYQGARGLARVNEARRDPASARAWLTSNDGACDGRA